MSTFDMDMHVKKDQSDKPLYAVFLKKKTARSPDRYFIVTKKAEYFLPNAFHGIGFWADQIPELDPETTASKQYLEDQKYSEVWIPYENIEFIESLVYIKR